MAYYLAFLSKDLGYHQFFVKQGGTQNMNIAIPLHVLAVVIWVGGMFFAHMALRPVALTQFEPPQRLPLMYAVLSKFFPWVWVAVVSILASGFWMIFSVYGGFAGLALHVHIMTALGLLMVGIFVYLYFVPFPQLGRGVAAQNWSQAGAGLLVIRRLIGVNLLLGLVTVLISTGGMYWLQ